MTRWWASLDRAGRALIVVAIAAAGLLTWWLAAGWAGYWQQYVAQNVLPPSVWTLVGIAIAHLQLHRKLDAQHAEMKTHVTAAAGGEEER